MEPNSSFWCSSAACCCWLDGLVVVVLVLVLVVVVLVELDRGNWRLTPKRGDSQTGCWLLARPLPDNDDDDDEPADEGRPEAELWLARHLWRPRRGIFGQ